ncbi:MAG: hypothetical protein A4E44_00982 [Methanosaeta sp. PtaB.Bin018]|jgi:hypothetical protein|nr:nickel pincer cofactor biosynthesis protein LarC [Methanothrix sp.]OPX75992.1 MAG: hypothetical protein A4E44_00982 [Methanosaeta sp. PtaB.Bin018]OPY43991.1 MAG: hypothetical protein A4E46_01581 [Methanosaeta sp. PtaU1.Bin016]
MKALLFDPSAGASGDMIMGCLLDLGADENTVREAVESVGCNLEISRQERSHIMAARVDVISDRRYQSLDEAVSILKSSSLQGDALRKALQALDILAAAESKVHGAPKVEARFHEIGALDALADIAGSCAALQSLNVQRVLCRSISVGGGYVKSAHGLLPVPGPASLEILRSYEIPWRGGPVDAELLTPTGAALLAALVDEFLPEFPLILPEKTGYGAGRKELPLPNVLRGIVAKIPHWQQMAAGDAEHEQHGDRVVQLETNVDDVTGEVLGRLMELLMDAGALDVSVLPALMKKGRSGNVIRVIARHEEMDRLAKIMIRETGSLGVRVFLSLHRYLAEREAGTVNVEICNRTFPVAVKISRMKGELLNVKPEYEECKRIADETGLPLRVVMKKVEEDGWRAACL